jgi:hypothetical protein
MLGMGLSTAAQAQVRCAANSDEAGNFDCPSSEIHSAMTAARAFRKDSKSFVNLSIYEQPGRLPASRKSRLQPQQILRFYSKKEAARRNPRSDSCLFEFIRGQIAFSGNH